MNKKGLDYVDWVISMGTFTIAVIAILIYLKPGVKADYSRESLLQIIDDNFFNDTQWVIRKVPLFIHRLQNPSSTEDRYVDIDYSNGFSFNANVPPNIDQTNDFFRCDSSSGLCQNMILNLIFYPNQPFNKDLPLVKAKCIPIGNSAVCDAELGSSETMDGINNNLLNSLSSKDYDSLKIAWKYPLSRDFAVYIDNDKITLGPEPPQQANIFVREIKYWRLSNQGTRNPIVINIRVW